MIGDDLIYYNNNLIINPINSVPAAEMIWGHKLGANINATQVAQVLVYYSKWKIWLGTNRPGWFS